jgi:hypothetical protein
MSLVRQVGLRGRSPPDCDDAEARPDAAETQREPPASRHRDSENRWADVEALHEATASDARAVDDKRSRVERRWRSPKDLHVDAAVRRAAAGVDAEIANSSPAPPHRRIGLEVERDVPRARLSEARRRPGEDSRPALRIACSGRAIRCSADRALPWRPCRRLMGRRERRRRRRPAAARSRFGIG